MIEEQQQEDNIFYIKLVSGEEVITELDVHDMDAEIIKFINPYKIDTKFADDGYLRQFIVKFMLYSDVNEFYIRDEHILIYVPAPDKLIEEYMGSMKKDEVFKHETKLEEKNQIKSSNNVVVLH